jgi:hypothetical protein
MTTTITSRRHVIGAVLATGSSGMIVSSAAAVEDDGIATTVAAAFDFDYATRDRNGNRGAVIRDDYWFISGKVPPRILGGPLRETNAPQFNAFGSCETNDKDQNSCTYVSLKQRIPAYTKYGSSITYGADQYRKLGVVLAKLPSSSSVGGPDAAAAAAVWSEAASYLEREDKIYPPGIIDAELKMLLFATAMLTSPNFPGPSKELLISRYYINELHFANGETLTALYEHDTIRARAAYAYGRDCWNSYYQTIDRQIVPKVGEKFTPIS